MRKLVPLPPPLAAYDLRLSRTDRAITLDRGLMVAQSTGEDWTDAALTLSTARPSGQVAASGVDPWFPRIEEQVVYDAPAAPAPPVAMAERSRATVEVAPVVLGGGVGNAELSMIGTTVVYRYPTPVTIRTGADAVRDARETDRDDRAAGIDALSDAYVTEHIAAHRGGTSAGS